jgi:glycosyltransferase involved in cell wall biosynthesis
MKISVAICTFSGEKFVFEQLQSILNQSRKVDEVIIVDDCSLDNTIGILESIIENSVIPIRLLKNDINIGAIKSFEKCIGYCSGDIIFLSDQDDIWLPNKVDRFLKFFEANGTVLALFSNAELIDEKNNLLNYTLWEKWSFNRELRIRWRDNKFIFSELLENRNKITGATAAFRSGLKPLLLPFEMPFGYWHDSWLGLIASGLNGLGFIEESTMLYRIHPHQQVGIGTSGYDKKYSPVTKDYFLNSIRCKFPLNEYIIYPRKNIFFKVRNLIRRGFGKFVYLLRY